MLKLLARWASRHRLRDMVRRNLPGLSAILLLLAAWEIVGTFAALLVLPRFSAVLAEILPILMQPTVHDSLGISLATLILGLFVSIVVGLLLGAVMGRYSLARDALDVYVNFGMSAPMIALIPVFIALFGVGYASRVITVVVFAIFPIIVNTYAGIRNVDRSLVEMACSFGANERQLFWRVRFPAARPLIRAGLRLGSSRGMKGVITGEVIIAIVGLGALVNAYGAAFNMERLYAIIILILGLALGTVRLVDFLAVRLLPGEKLTR